MKIDEKEIGDIDALISIISRYNLNKVKLVVSFIEKLVITKNISIADIGCGTGLLFTIPFHYFLSKNKKIPFEIMGYDIDKSSIETAYRIVSEINYKKENLKFKILPSEIINTFHAKLYDLDKELDIICLIEVLEHLEKPQYILNYINKIMKKGGYFFLSIPNGYGPYEVEAFLYRHVLKYLLSSLVMKKKPYKKEKSRNKLPWWFKETMYDENNIHIQHYLLKSVKLMLKESGFELLKIHNTNFLSGPISNIVLHKLKLEENNLKHSSKLPNFMASGWLFIARKK